MHRERQTTSAIDSREGGEASEHQRKEGKKVNATRSGFVNIEN
jgi:hypothetical protein